MSRHQFREWVDILETLWGALGEGPLEGAWVDCDAIALEGGDQDGPDMDEGKDTDEAACVKVESMVCFDAVAHVNILGDERRFFEAVEKVECEVVIYNRLSASVANRPEVRAQMS